MAMLCFNKTRFLNKNPTSIVCLFSVKYHTYFYFSSASCDSFVELIYKLELLHIAYNRPYRIVLSFSNIIVLDHIRFSIISRLDGYLRANLTAVV